MRLRFRLLWVLLTALWQGRMEIFAESVLTSRVWPHDVDVLKITNDRFLALMDLGRMDIAFRVGLLPAMMRRRWVPLATFTAIRFRHPLKLFQKYRLHTRIIYWDAHTFYFEQRFEREHRTLATGYVCATFLGPHGPVSPATIVAAAGRSVVPPAIPPLVARLQAAEAEMHQIQVVADSASAVSDRFDA